MQSNTAEKNANTPRINRTELRVARVDKPKPTHTGSITQSSYLAQMHSRYSENSKLIAKHEFKYFGRRARLEFLRCHEILAKSL